LVGVLIFAKSKFIIVVPDLYTPSYSSPQVYQCWISKSDNLAFKDSLKSPSSILDSILKLKGGYDELNDEKHEKLINSILAKAYQNSQKEISINKFFLKILSVIEPVDSDQRFWRIMSESQKPIKSELSGTSEVRLTDLLGLAQNAPDKQAKTRSKGSSSIFAEAFSNPRKLSPMQKAVKLKMAKKKNNFSNVNSLG
jgi:hypothetical protein